MAKKKDVLLKKQYNEQQKANAKVDAEMKKQEEDIAKNVVYLTTKEPEEPVDESLDKEREAVSKALAELDDQIAAKKAEMAEDAAKCGKEKAQADDRAEAVAKAKAKSKAEADAKEAAKAKNQSEVDALSSTELGAEVKKAEDFMESTKKQFEALMAKKQAEIDALKKEAEKKAAAEEKARLEAEAEKARKVKEAAEAKKAEEARKAKEAAEAKKAEEARKAAAIKASAENTPIGPRPTVPKTAKIGYTGPSKIYRYYDHTIKGYSLTSDLWVADQAAPNAWKAIWVWRENGEIHHQMTNQELREFFPA